MNTATLIIDGVLLLGMIGVSLYGAGALPAGALVPIHFGLGSYNNWVPKSIGLVIWPAGGVLVYVILAIVLRNQQVHGGSGPTIGLTIALVVMLITQVGALRVAFARNGRDS